MKKYLKTFFILFIINISLPLTIKAESFVWPTDGYVGWRFYDDTNGFDTSGFKVLIDGTYHYMHTGVDIWSTSDGGWNNDVVNSSNPVYSAYQGTVYYTDYLGIQVKHSNTLYTNYWHLRNVAVSSNDTVSTSTILGYQDDGNGIVHVHLTVTTAAMEGSNHDNTGAIDPTPYFGTELDVRQTGTVISWGTFVKHGPCGLDNVVIQQNMTGDFTCTATNSIIILPTSILTGTQIYTTIN
ncbi:MAG: M23 family metallopeptidase [Candidatus Dojkabacteria bacterium]